MIESGIDKPNPRHQFIIDFLEHCKTWKIQPEDHIILQLDGNEPMNKEERGIKQLMRHLNLVDVFLEKDHNPKEFRSHINGSKRIDYVLCTRHTLQFINAIGYAPFYEHFDSDHRMIYYDVNTTIFESELATLISPPTRLIGTNSKPDKAADYINHLDVYFRQHKIYEQFQQLYDEATEVPSASHNTNQMQERLDQIDKLVTHLMLKCETLHCTRKRQIMWSPEIMHSYLMINYWRLEQKEKRLKIDLSRQKSSIINKLPQTLRDAINGNQLSATAALKKEKENQVELMKHHWDLRKEYLQSIKKKLDPYDKDYNKEEASKLKSLQVREKMKRNFQVLRATFHPAKGSGISKIDIPNPNQSGTYIRVSDPRKVEELLIDRNIKHFSQAKNTPFTSELMEEQLDYQGTNEIATKILEGDIPEQLASCNINVQTILKKLGDNRKLHFLNLKQR